VTGTGPSYTFSELRQIWLDAGGAPDQADTAAAIASAESGGCRYALAGPVDVRPVKLCRYHQTDGENSHGLWQINIAAGANPSYAGVDLFDPDANARVARDLSSNGLNWRPWSTFEDGAYLAFLPGGSRPALGHSGGQAATAGTPVGLRGPTPVFADNPVHLGDAFALLTGALAHDLTSSTRRVAHAASRVGGVGH
jgi:hypothetical protein